MKINILFKYSSLDKWDTPYLENDFLNLIRIYLAYKNTILASKPRFILGAINKFGDFFWSST